jgi:lysophospholipase L1-like esterase
MSSLSQRITPEQLLHMPGNPEVEYRLDRAPFTRYYWDGTQFMPYSVSGGGIAGVSSLPKLAKAFAKMRAGAGRVKILVLGDSTTAGDGSNNTSPGLRSTSYPSFLATQLAGASGLLVNTSSIFGSAGKTSVANMQSYNPLITAFPTGWALNAAVTAGGAILANTTNTATMTYAPGVAFDRIDVWFYRTAANGTFTVDIGGAALATIDSSGANGLIKQTIATGAGAAVSPVNIQRTGAGGGVYICAVHCYDSTKPAIDVWNAGYAASTTTHWNTATSVYSPRNAIAVLAPDLTIIDLGINDRNGATTVEAYAANLQNICTVAKVSGDVMFKIPMQSNPANFASTDWQNQFDAAMRAVAAANVAPVVSSIDAIGDYAAAAANGYMQDDRHALDLGYARIASNVAKTLLAQV